MTLKELPPHGGYAIEYDIHTVTVLLTEATEELQKTLAQGWELVSFSVHHHEATIVYRRHIRYRREVREG
jgi:hypothetical protein